MPGIGFALFRDVGRLSFIAVLLLLPVSAHAASRDAVCISATEALINLSSGFSQEVMAASEQESKMAFEALEHFKIIAGLKDQPFRGAPKNKNFFILGNEKISSFQRRILAARLEQLRLDNAHTANKFLDPGRVIVGEEKISEYLKNFITEVERVDAVIHPENRTANAVAILSGASALGLLYGLIHPLPVSLVDVVSGLGVIFGLDVVVTRLAQLSGKHFNLGSLQEILNKQKSSDGFVYLSASSKIDALLPFISISGDGVPDMFIRKDFNLKMLPTLMVKLTNKITSAIIRKKFTMLKPIHLDMILFRDPITDKMTLINFLRLEFDARLPNGGGGKRKEAEEPDSIGILNPGKSPTL